jgi:hypothetical protein
VLFWRLLRHRRQHHPTLHDEEPLIVTPDEAIWCAEPHRPPGILWEHLDQDKIAEVPALAALAARR